MIIDIDDAFGERQSGRTTRMITKALVYPNSVIVMRKPEDCLMVRQKIGPEQCKLHKVTYYNHSDHVFHFRCHNGPLFIDHYVWETLTVREAYILNIECFIRNRIKSVDPQIWRVKYVGNYRDFNTEKETDEFVNVLKDLGLSSEVVRV